MIEMIKKSHKDQAAAKAQETTAVPKSNPPAAQPGAQPVAQAADTQQQQMAEAKDKPEEGPVEEMNPIELIEQKKQ